MARAAGFVRFAFVSLFVVGIGSGRAVLADEEDFGPNNRPAFLLVSIADTFDVPTIPLLEGGSEDVQSVRDAIAAGAAEAGSPLVRVTIGTYVAGENFKTTRFSGLSPITIDLGDAPPDPLTGEPSDYDGNQFTILGSFKTLDPDDTIHMMTPYSGGVTSAGELAFFNASPFFDDLDLEDALPPFPTTLQVALFVYDHKGDAEATLQEIADSMFDVPTESPLQMVCHSPCEAEGTLFPHSDDDDGNPFFSVFDPAGTVNVAICVPVDVDIKPDTTQNSINIGHNGDLPVAVLTTDDFDAVEELDPETFVAVLREEDGHLVAGSEVYADHWAEEDVDDDGDLDVILHFSVPGLVAGDDAPLSGDSEVIDFVGLTYDGQCVVGSDSVHPVGHN
jgi:hypothetical protein